MKRLPLPLVVPLIVAAIPVVGFMLASASSREVTVYPSEQIVVDGSTRTFRLVVPPRRTEEQLPIVFDFHGHGNTPESEADRTRLDQLAASQGFVLVHPAAVDGNWKTRGIDSAPADKNRDIRFFDELLGHLIQRLDVDRTRVYLMGMSMGADFAHELALARSRKIAAAVAHSASAPSDIECQRPFPILMVVGANESGLLCAARDDARRYRDNGHTCELLVVQGIGHEWSQRHNLGMWRFLERHRLGE